MASIMEEPQCLIDSGPDGKLVVNQHVLEQLKGLDKQVVVVGIAGPYRTGKSYLMNRLAGHMKGFALGSTVQSKTKGIWIWVRDHPHHSDRYLVLLDTEGLGDVEKGDENNDNQILCVTLLLASTFVYNVAGVIGNDAVHKLHFITEMSKHIQIRSKSKDDTDFDWYFPDFVYVIRDFFLELEIDGKEVTADEYLEHALGMKKGANKNVQTFNKIRECIRTYFKKRKCFTFVVPVMDKKKMKCLDEVSENELSPAFVEETRAFLDYIFTKGPVKQISGKKLTGSMLGSLVEVYVEQMKTSMPQVENAVDTMAQLENKKAREEAVAFYSSNMRQSLQMPVLDDSEFSRCHNDCLQQAIEVFLSKSVFDKDHQYQRHMNEDIEANYRDLVAMNENVCRERCLEELMRGYQTVGAKVKSGAYARSGGFRQYKDDMARMREECESNLGQLGVKMRHVILEFLHSKQSEEDTILSADEKVTQAERQKEAEQQKALAMQKRKEEAERATAMQIQFAKDQDQAHRENIERLEKRMKEDAEANRKHYEEMVTHRLEEQKRFMMEGFKKESDALNARIEDLRRQQQQQANQQRSRGGCILL